MNHPPAPFIVGVGRSGTTLLRLMLDAHSALCIPPETSFVPAAASLLRDEAGARTGFFELVTGSKTWPDFHLEPARLHETLSAIEPFNVGSGLRAFYGLCAERQGKRRFGDKSPAYALRMKKILAVLPEARFIHLIRDGRDVALSHTEVWFGREQPLEAHLEAWRQRVERTRELGRQCPHYLELRYEDLVQDSEPALRAICAFIDLAYEPGMLDYFKTARARLEDVTTAYNADGSARVTKEERLVNHRFTSFPPLTSRIFRYRREMSDEARRRAEAIAGDLLARLGYETEGHAPSGEDVAPADASVARRSLHGRSASE